MNYLSYYELFKMEKLEKLNIGQKAECNFMYVMKWIVLLFNLIFLCPPYYNFVLTWKISETKKTENSVRNFMYHYSA